jgi:hypothetical protein
MSISLHKAIIPSYLQILGAVNNLLDKAEQHCASNGLAADAITKACLAADMRPFAYQITSVCHHSLGAIEGVRKGVFSPDTAPPPEDFDSLRTKLANTINAVNEVTEAEMETFIGRDMRFEMTGLRIDFIAEEFLLSFSQPNFYFHATTAYDILRWQGLDIGKRDFLGAMRRL